MWIQIIETVVIPIFVSSVTSIAVVMLNDRFFLRFNKNRIKSGLTQCGQPQIYHTTIQTKEDIQRIQDEFHETTYNEAVYNTHVDQDTEKVTASLAFETNRLSELDLSKNWTFFLIKNNSKIDIVVDSFSYQRTNSLQMKPYACKYIKAGQSLCYVFDLSLKPQNIIIDFTSVYLRFPVTDKTGMLKLEIGNQK